MQLGGFPYQCFDNECTTGFDCILYGCAKGHGTPPRLPPSAAPDPSSVGLVGQSFSADGGGPLNVLIGCEESGVGRRAFAALGHNAYSNDLIPARDGSLNHLQMNVVDAIDYMDWDIIILHPECTCMAVCGNSTYGEDKPKHAMRIEALNWTLDLWEKAKAKARIGAAMENPASTLWSYVLDPVQYIQPYQFGHLEQKLTGIARYNLPRLEGTNNVYYAMRKLPKAQRERIHYMGPSATRTRDRSESFTGILSAMAMQWGGLVVPRSMRCEQDAG